MVPIAIFLSIFVALATAQACSSAASCPLDKSICQPITIATKQCSPCSMQASTLVGGGSCYCDPSKGFCATAQAQLGTCQPYTVYNKVCSKDTDCQTRADNVFFTNYISENLYCINKLCKPCSPALWDQYNTGGPNRTYVCPGYDAHLSNTYGRYAVGSSLPKFTFQCSASGDIVVLNSVLDFNYQYPGGDRSNWTPATTGSPTSTLAPRNTTTGSKVKPQGSTSPATSSVGEGDIFVHWQPLWTLAAALIVGAVLDLVAPYPNH